MKTNKDVLLVSLSDMHSGGSTALFPDYQMTFSHNGKDAMIARATPLQARMYKHWIACGKAIKERGKGKRIVVVHNGDALEGHHHGSIQIVTPNPKHQTEIHIELMETLLKESGHSVKNGDELHYTSGTESHTGWEEYGISEHFDAHFHDELQAKINGVAVWFTHHGGGAGKGANEGNGYRNWLKDIYFECLRAGKTPPDMVVTAHFHKPIYQTYVMDWHTIHGMILPSWQQKTRYAHRVAPFQRNDIGLMLTTITAGGDVRVEKPLLMEQP